MKLRALIIEDEDASLENLKLKIRDYCADVNVVGWAHSVEAGLELIKSTAFDLLFLDIELSPGYGFDILESLEEVSFETIFTTGYEYAEYMHKAIDFDAADYLVKTIDIDDLNVAVNKVKKRIENKNAMRSMPIRKEGYIQLNDSKGIIITKPEKINYVVAKDGYLIFYLENKREATVWSSIKHYESILGQELFFRVHHSYLVNRNFIEIFLREDGGVLKLLNGKHVPVSRRKKDDFLRWFTNSY